jgi:hypothetical protein
MRFLSQKLRPNLKRHLRATSRRRTYLALMFHFFWVQTHFYVVLHGDRDRSILLYWVHMAFHRLDFT